MHSIANRIAFAFFDHQLLLADTHFAGPGWEKVVRVLLMEDYNTRVVLLGTLLLGVCAGVVGTFMLLRKRSLVGDVVGHASLPGIGIAFLVMETASPGSGKWVPGLLLGALIAGASGVLCTTLIRRHTRIKEDAALAIVLSVFFGLGIALFTVIQNIPTGNAAGLNQFIFGKAASLVANDVKLIAISAFVVLLISTVLFKEFSLLCFDENFAAAQGWPIHLLDVLMMGLVVGVAVIGLQSVGLLLVVAMMIIPATSARFWTDDLRKMTLTAGMLGGLGAFFGVMMSALFPRLAAGAVIVLVGAFFFALSLLFGTQRGAIRRLLLVRQMKQSIGRHDLLRAFYECLESSHPDETTMSPQSMTVTDIPFGLLLNRRSWTLQRLQKLIAAAERNSLVHAGNNQDYRFTELGAREAMQVVRNHRLWEIYLINYADIAPSHVDRDADLIEHVLGPELVDELEDLMAEQYPEMSVPPSPHPIAVGT